MSDLDNKRYPLSDLGIEDESMLEDYNIKVKSNKYSDAVKLLDEKKCNKGIRASILNSIKQSILNLEVYLLNLTADADTIYSLTEPTAEQMQGKLYWIKPIL